jgi:hypothetical protein
VGHHRQPDPARPGHGVYDDERPAAAVLPLSDEGSPETQEAQAAWLDIAQLEAYAASVGRTARRLGHTLRDQDAPGFHTQIALRALEFTADRLLTHARQMAADGTTRNAS